MMELYKKTAFLLFLLPGLLKGMESYARECSFPADTTREAQYYQIETIPIPDSILLEVGGMAFTPQNQLGISTRRGEVWILENPYLKKDENPVFRRYAYGLHEALGLAYSNKGFLLSQRGELTHLTDTDGDGRADRFRAVYSWPLSGNYHEYSYGPVITRNGDLLVTLNLSWIGKGASLAKWRGWLLRIKPDGTMTPIATGLRSPAGLGVNQEGDIFYTENQGDWVGAGRLTHLRSGDFAGNPAGLKWSGEPSSPLSLKPEDITSSEEQTLDQVAQRIPALKRPAVWFPHGLMGVSTSGILVDTTKGGFGPFQGQMFVGDQGHSKVMRVFLEKVNGEYQGACFPFREGFSSGVLRLNWGKDNAMFVGMTSRGWSSTGPELFGLQRLRWTGKVPFEIKTIRAQSDGFLLEFTQPVDEQLASNPHSYEVTGFTYHYWSRYGSKIIQQESCMVHQAVVSKDRKSVKLTIHGLREGYIHEVKAAGVRSAVGADLLHTTGYYTLNKLPGGKALAKMMAHGVHENYSIDKDPKRVTKIPEGWTTGPDITLTVGTKPGLQFDVAELRVKAGSKVELVFNNNDDMLHNLVVTAPGAADKVGAMAMNLGLQGTDRHYVPDTELVLAHTALLQPDTSEKIYFAAPTRKGVYSIVCTFPGHYTVMRAKLIVD